MAGRAISPAESIHTVISTAANVSYISQTAKLLHGRETQVHADAGSIGVENRDEIKTHRAAAIGTDFRASEGGGDVW